MPGTIRLRWTPLAVGALLDLEDYGKPEMARQIIAEVEGRLVRQPGIYREVAIQAYPGTRKRVRVRRLFLAGQLPYLI